MADINSVAQQFTSFYYRAFDENRATLEPLYVRLCPGKTISIISDSETDSVLLLLPFSCSSQRESSMLTFEGTPIQGVRGIIEKLTVCPIAPRVLSFTYWDGADRTPAM